MNRILITVLFIALSCTSPSTESTNGNTDTLVAPGAETEGEDFNVFFERFNRDSLFQIERVKFPLRFVISDLDDLESLEETELEDWRHFSFDYADSFATRKIDSYTQTLKNYGDTTRLELRGVDNGIHVNYVFARENGKWFFVLGEDYSN